MKNKTKKNSCVICLKNMARYSFENTSPYEVDQVILTVCINLKCPNYALFAIPVERMPKQTEIKHLRGGDRNL